MIRKIAYAAGGIDIPSLPEEIQVALNQVGRRSGTLLYILPMPLAAAMCPVSTTNCIF